MFIPTKNRQSSSLAVTTPRRSIIGLLLGRAPFAIFFAVVTVIINAVKSQPLWAFTHISKKIGKVFPLFAVGNSPSSIAVIGMIFRVVTTLLHILPGVIGWGFIHSVSTRTLSNSRPASFAAAAKRQPINACSRDLFSGATFALTKVIRVVSSICYALYNRPHKTPPFTGYGKSYAGFGAMSTFTGFGGV